MGIDTSTARWTGSDGGGGGVGKVDEIGGSKLVVIVGGVVEGRSGALGIPVDWPRPVPRYGTRKSRRGDHEASRYAPTPRRKRPAGACRCVIGTSVAPDTG